jgi:O-antigen ligase
LNLFVSISTILLLFFSIPPYAGQNPRFEAVICAAVFVLALICLIRKKSAGLPPAENLKLLAAPVLLALYSSVQGLFTLLTHARIVPPSAVFPYSFDLTGSFRNGLKILAVTVFVLLLLQTFRRNIRPLVGGLIVTGNFFALLGIVRFVLQSYFPGTFPYFIFGHLTPETGFGTYLNQNHFAFLMLLTTGLNLGLLCFGNLGKYGRMLLFLFFLNGWAALVLTGSRGGIISSFAVIAVLIFFPAKTAAARRRKSSRETSGAFTPGRKLVVFAVLSSVLAAGVLLIGQERVVNRFEKLPLQMQETESSGGFRRIDVYAATLGLIAENAIFGVGFGGFRYAVSRYADIPGRIAPEQAHNDYLEFAACGGLVALALAVWFLYVFFSQVRQRFGEPADDFSAAARIGALCGLTGIAFHSLFDFGLQIFANLLFCAALVAVAVHRERPAENTGPPVEQSFAYIGSTILVLALAAVSLLYGYSNHVYARADRDFLLAAERPVIPFDAGFYDRRASAFEQSGNPAGAIENLKTAIYHRPEDYSLWLHLGRIQEKAGRSADAAASFRRAIELAPHYGEPHYRYGMFLVKNQAVEKGFAELRRAVRADAGYFYLIADLAWRTTAGDGPRTIHLAAPATAAEIEELNAFFFSVEAFDALVRLNCADEKIPDMRRAGLVKKLLKKRRLFEARRIYDCRDGTDEIYGFENGGFETPEFKKDAGFGWKVKDLPGAVRFSVDENIIPDLGRYSLKIDFNGAYKPTTVLMSQTVPVEKNQKYRLTFFYKTGEIITAGQPVVRVFLKNPVSDELLREIPLRSETYQWVGADIVLETGEDTLGLEFKLARHPCRQRLCPVYGELWLDNFSLRKDE